MPCISGLRQVSGMHQHDAVPDSGICQALNAMTVKLTRLQLPPQDSGQL